MIQTRHGFFRSLLGLKPIREYVARRIDERVKILTGLAPLTEFREDDVFIVGYPKSGNTWFQNLLGGLIYGLDVEYTPSKVFHDLIPDVHRTSYYFKRYRNRMFFKSHHLPQPEYKKVVYLLRDGRDVMVSYLHYLQARSRKVDWADIFKAKAFGKWQDHVEAWLSNPYGAEMVIITYEGLKRDPVTELRKFCYFVPIDRDDDCLNRVAQKASFAKMHEQEAKWGWHDPSWPKDQFFTRRGEVGSYQDEMPRSVLEEFMEEAGATLAKLGYI